MRIRGGERLAWSQPAPNAAAVRTYSFLLFINGTLASISDTRCSDVAQTDGYECSGRLPPMRPGTHTLEVAAVADGQQSARSAPLTVTMLASTAGQSMTPAFLNVPGAAGTLPDGSVVADGLGTVSSLSAIPDGRLVFIENGHVVRVLDHESRLHTAYELDRAEGTVLSLAVDPNFQHTRWVYLSHTDRGHDGATTLSISRFREVGEVLGERATIVRGLPFAAARSAPLGVDQEGLVYVALPAAADARANIDYSSVVLRFTASGGVPRGNPKASPVFAIGFAEPTALAIDRTRGEVWLAGTHPMWDHSVAVVPIDPPEGSVWPLHPRAGLPRAAEQSGFKAGTLSLDYASVLSFASKHVVHRGTLTPDGRIGALETFRVGSLGTISSLTTGPGRELYIAVQSSDGLTSSIQLLTHR